MSFIKLMFENQIKEIFKEVDELSLKHIEIMEKRNNSKSVKQLSDINLDKEIEKKMVFFND